MDKVTDPADKGKQKGEEIDIRMLSIDDLNPSDLKPLPRGAARVPHPFDGYPEKQIKVGTYKKGNKEVDLVLNATHLIALNPSYSPPQDPSGNNVQVTGKDLKDKNVTIETCHNRVTTYRGDSFNAVFDRDMEVKGVRYKYAIVPEPVHRAQILFKLNTRDKRIEVDERYILLDQGQRARIRQVFQLIINPKLQVERIAGAIAGDSPESLDDLAGTAGGLEG